MTIPLTYTLGDRSWFVASCRFFTAEDRWGQAAGVAGLWALTRDPGLRATPEFAHFETQVKREVEVLEGRVTAMRSYDKYTPLAAELVFDAGELNGGRPVVFGVDEYLSRRFAPGVRVMAALMRDPGDATTERGVFSRVKGPLCAVLVEESPRRSVRIPVNTLSNAAMGRARAREEQYAFEFASEPDREGFAAAVTALCAADQLAAQWSSGADPCGRWIGQLTVQLAPDAPAESLAARVRSLAADSGVTFDGWDASPGPASAAIAYNANGEGFPLERWD